MTRLSKRSIHKILEKGLLYIERLPYQVSIKHLFHEMMRQGYYKTEKDFDKFEYMMRKVQKNFTFNWGEEYLSDFLRMIYEEEHSRNRLPTKEQLNKLLEFQKDKDHTTIILYEANGMVDQFKFYTKAKIPLFAIGSPAQSYKIKLSKSISQISELEITETYNDLQIIKQKPIKVLVFGKLNDEDELINYSNLADVSLRYKNEVIDCEIIAYPTLENLSDEEAGAIITGAIK